MLSAGQSIRSWYDGYHGSGKRDVRLDMVPVFILYDHIARTMHYKRARWWRGRTSTEVFHEFFVRHEAAAIIDLSACRLGQLKVDSRTSRTSSSTPSSSIKIGGFVGSISIVSPGLRTFSPALAGVMSVYKTDSVDRDRTKETTYRLTSGGCASLVPPRVDNVVVVLTCR